MRAKEFINEGGWANAKTQETVITPQVIGKVVQIMQQFGIGLNKFLAQKNLPPIEIGEPCGSGTYWRRDLVQQPNKEYGDIDIHFYIPEMEGLTNNQTVTLFANAVKEFCDLSPNFETENGKNVIVQIGPDSFVQIDLVVSYYKNKEWGKALAPEWNVKGVLSASLYSALAEALNLSIGSHGIQAKTLNGQRVKFTTIKGVELHQVTSNKDNWAVDVATYLGCKKLSPRLKQYPGLMGEVRISDIVNSIRGIAESLELNGIASESDTIAAIKQIYATKINKVINSSKFDKAATPAAIQKAEYTKKMLASKLEEILGLFK